ncbi:MAG: phosphoglycerate kinase [Candidatus Helarchaeota archaeon]|nr:phosphoglycerate kinase [Candidatus Helarchaeota archaeon]
MKYGLMTLDDVDVKGKKVLIRFDLNSTVTIEDPIIKDTLRLDQIKPTLDDLKEAAVIILAHQGRKGKKDFTSLQPHANVLKEMYGDRFKFVDDTVGEKAVNAIRGLKPGEILLLENVRFLEEEMQKGTPGELSKTKFVQTLAPLVDLYVNDAYGAAHRGQTSLVGFTPVLPSYAGRILEREIDVMENTLTKPDKPMIYVIGGAKVETKFKVLKNLLENNKADKILVCGLLQNIMLAGAGVDIKEINKKPIKGFEEYIGTAKEIYDKYKDQLVLPVDLALNKNNERVEVGLDALSEEFPSNDIGHKTAENFVEIIKEAGTVAANGPAGVFENEPFAYGSKEVLHAMADSKAYSIVGGGEMGGYANTLKLDMNFISTGGGAMLAYLTGKKLTVLAALEKAAQRMQS